MLKSGILNPAINSLLSRVRHTNTLVIADRGFPFFSGIETIDISLVDDIPRVLDVLLAIKSCFLVGQVWMANEFHGANDGARKVALNEALFGIPVTYETHSALKLRVQGAIGLIRTADTTQYANLVVESA